MGQNQGKAGGKKIGTLSRKKTSEKSSVDNSGNLRKGRVFTNLSSE
jgi:hypothetical protein